MDKAIDAVVKVESGGVKDEKEGGDHIEINGTRYNSEDGKMARGQSPKEEDLMKRRARKGCSFLEKVRFVAWLLLAGIVKDAFDDEG
jgi:hypothetical protein